MNKIIEFETKVAKLYEAGKIKAPTHLSKGNELQLTEIFKHVKKTDWIFSTWRNHYHWLMSGRSEKELLKQIIDGHSMHVFGYRFFTSAIVGGIAPIALGVAMSLKRKKCPYKVWCFLGDMAYSGGLAQESIRYAQGNDLPIYYILEDNGLSVSTPTQEVWGKCRVKKVIKYKYKRGYPHAGTGKFVLF